jgi:hypothetical protein
MSRGTAYYTSFSRALHKYATNGFFARDLDADDFAFIEGIRERGYVACGSLGLPVPTQCTYSDDVNHRVGLEEETEFWKRPYPVDQVVVRRSGPVRPGSTRPTGMTPAAIRLHENRKLLAKERADEAQRLLDRQIEQIRRDIEWEKAQPDKKRTQLHRAPDKKPTRLHVDTPAEASAKACAKELRDEKQSRLRAKQMRAEAAAAIKLADVALAARRQNLQAQIMAIMRRAFPNPVTIEMLMASTQCQDMDFMVSCANELITAGALAQKPQEPAIQQEDNDALLLPIPDACELLHCTPQTLYKLRREGKIQILNGNVRVLKSSIDNLRWGVT